MKSIKSLKELKQLLEFEIRDGKPYMPPDEPPHGTKEHFIYHVQQSNKHLRGFNQNNTDYEALGEAERHFNKAIKGIGDKVRAASPNTPAKIRDEDIAHSVDQHLSGSDDPEKIGQIYDHFTSGKWWNG